MITKPRGRSFLVNFSLNIRQQEHVVLVEAFGRLAFFETGAPRDRFSCCFNWKNFVLSQSQRIGRFFCAGDLVEKY
jgi:hypothetical protein